MRKFYTVFGPMLALASLVASSPTPASALELESGRLYGFVSTTGSYYMTANNFYSFDLASPSTGTMIQNAAMLSYKPDVAGVFLDNGEFIGVGKQSSYSTTKIVMKLATGSENYWTQLKSVTASFSNATDMANDKGTVYVWYQASLGAGWNLGKVDTDELTVTPIGEATTTKMLALAAGDGKVWGIASDGNLYSISPSDASLSKIGPTGKTVADKPQSACYDSASGTIIWARYDDSSMFNKVSEIVSVNPATGASSTKGTLTNTPQVLGLSTPVSINADAPGEVTDLTATNNGTDNDITVSFTMPTVNNGGTALNANLQGLTYTISVDGEVKVDKKASSVGAQVSETIASTPGTHTVTVFASQSLYGDGPEVKTSLFVGMDTPGAVKNPQAVSTGTEVTVTWEAPVGKNGGTYDAAKLAYKVVRMPGDVVVSASQTATTFTETITAEKLQGYTYVITTIYDGVDGESAETPEVFAGPSFEVTRENPYSQDFQDCANVADAGFFFTGKSANASYSDPVLQLLTQDENKYLQVTPDASYQRVNNPKLFTTALKLKAKHSYRLSFKFRCGSNYGSTFTVYLSDKPTADCTNVVTIIPETSYGYPDTGWQDFTDDRVPAKEFQVDETGVYFISVQHGFMATTWDFDDFKVEDITEPGIPNAATGMEAAVIGDSRDVEISFTLPTEDNNGDNPQMTSVELKRGEDVVHTWTEDLVPGAEMTWTDVKAPLGNNTYTVTVSNANGTSTPVSASVKVGLDYDLSISATDAPESVVKGRTFTISATVLNNGINRAPMGEEEYTLALVRNMPDGSTNVVMLWNGATLESDKEMRFIHSLKAPEDAGEKLSYYFYLSYDLDQNLEDNRSENIEIAVVTPEFPAATDLAATWNDGKFDLVWTAPEYDAETVTLKGYDIYANDVRINGDTPVTETSYSAPAEEDTDYTYYVVAVYDLGSSVASNKVTVSHSGVSGVADGAFAVSVSGNTLSVAGAAGRVNVYNLSGVAVASAEAGARTVSFTLAHGIYMVVADGKAVKVIL